MPPKNRDEKQEWSRPKNLPPGSRVCIIIDGLKIEKEVRESAELKWKLPAVDSQKPRG